MARWMIVVLVTVFQCRATPTKPTPPDPYEPDKNAMRRIKQACVQLHEHLLADPPAHQVQFDLNPAGEVVAAELHTSEGRRPAGAFGDCLAREAAMRPEELRGTGYTRVTMRFGY